MAQTISLRNKFDHIVSWTFQARISRERNSPRVFIAVSVLIFAASTVLTVASSMSMAGMREMPMPGDWTMSAAWMRLPGETWVGAGASFVGMWTVMMIAMMLPSVSSLLWRYQQVIGRAGDKRLGYLSTLIAFGYFSVWTVLGIGIFAVGVALTRFEMRQPALAGAMPMIAGMAVLIAGLLQFSAWKQRHLACCREVPGSDRVVISDAHTAWRKGLRLGVQCTLCCAGFTVIFLIGGVMNLFTMAIVGTAITLERLAPASKLVAQAIGAIMIVGGLVLIGRTLAAV